MDLGQLAGPVVFLVAAGLAAQTVLAQTAGFTEAAVAARDFPQAQAVAAEAAGCGGLRFL